MSVYIAGKVVVDILGSFVTFLTFFFFFKGFFSRDFFCFLFFVVVDIMG